MIDIYYIQVRTHEILWMTYRPHSVKEDLSIQTPRFVETCDILRHEPFLIHTTRATSRGYQHP